MDYRYDLIVSPSEKYNTSINGKRLKKSDEQIKKSSEQIKKSSEQIKKKYSINLFKYIGMMRPQYHLNN